MGDGRKWRVTGKRKRRQVRGRGSIACAPKSTLTPSRTSDPRVTHSQDAADPKINIAQVDRRPEGVGSGGSANPKVSRSQVALDAPRTSPRAYAHSLPSPANRPNYVVQPRRVRTPALFGLPDRPARRPPDPPQHRPKSALVTPSAGHSGSALPRQWGAPLADTSTIAAATSGRGPAEAVSRPASPKGRNPCPHNPCGRKQTKRTPSPHAVIQNPGRREPWATDHWCLP